MAIVFFLILRTSLHVRGPNSHLNNKPAPCFLTYETPIYLHLAVPECSGRVTMLAEVQIRASAFGTRLLFLVLLWCGSRTRTKAWVNFPRRSTFIFPLFTATTQENRRKGLWHQTKKLCLAERGSRWKVRKDGVEEMGKKVEWGE